MVPWHSSDSFDHNTVENTGQDIPGIFIRHLIISVVRYPHLGALNQSTNLVEGSTHADESLP
jgi:hypothetical protein